jgi:hypothetical protein
VPGLRLNRDAVPVPLDDLLANGQELFAFVEALEQAENFWRPSPMALGGRDRIANGSRVSGAGDTIIGIGGFTAFPRRGRRETVSVQFLAQARLRLCKIEHGTNMCWIEYLWNRTPSRLKLLAYAWRGQPRVPNWLRIFCITSSVPHVTRTP